MAKNHPTSLEVFTTSANNSASVNSQDAEVSILTNTLLSPTTTSSLKLEAAHQLKAYSLSAEREAELFETMRSSNDNDKKDWALNKLCQYVYASVFSIAHENRNKCANLNERDLFSHGMIGVQEALAHYDPAKSNGAKFSTYAYSHITHAITEACTHLSCAITLTKSQARRVKKLLKTKEAFILRYGREPSVDELAERLPGYSKKYITNHKNGFSYTVSLDAQVNPGDSDDKTTVRDTYDNTHSSKSFVEDIIKNESFASLRENLNRLDVRTQKVINCRYWEGKKLEEIGRELNISTQSVSRIEKEGLTRLRAMMTMPSSVA